MSKWDGPKWCDVRFRREAVLLLWPQGKEGKVEFISLSNAASQLYTEARRTNQLAAAASEWGESDEETLDWWGGYIAVTKNTRLFGRYA